MKRVLLALALVIALVGLSAPHTVSATPNTKVDLFQDRSDGGLEAIDMAGPTGFGFVNYNQDDTSALRVLVSLKNAQPNTSYTVFLVCGPTHAAACGFIDIGTLLTNASGNGNLSVTIPLGTLQASPFGAGSRTDHIDLIGSPGGGVYAVSSINYTVPSAMTVSSLTASQQSVGAADPTR